MARFTDIRSSEITPRSIYLRRREFLTATGAALAALATRGFAATLAAANTLSITKKVVTTTDTPTPYRSSPPTTTSTSSDRQGRPRAKCRRLQTEAVVGDRRRRVRQAWHLHVRGCPQTACARGAHLPAAMRRRMVDGHPVDRLSARRSSEAVRAGRQRKFVEFVTVLRPEEMPGQRALHLAAAVALQRRTADGRSDASAHDARRRALRRGTAQSEWRAASAGRAMEVRLQEHQVDRQDPLRREAAADHVEESQADYYGFYSNVNPAQTRSSFRDQSTERRLGEFLMRKTLPFNGYADQVASLYAGMDLKKNY